MKATIKDVSAAARMYYGVQNWQLSERTNAYDVSRPRQIVMTVCRELTSRSLPQIGKHFGGFDHTTVLHAIRSTHRRVRENPDTARTYVALRDISLKIAAERKAREAAAVRQAIAMGQIIPAGMGW